MTANSWRITLFIFLLIVILISAGLLIATYDCKHDYEHEVTSAPTCVLAGEATYTCVKCGEFYTESIPPLNGHSFSSTYEKDNGGHWQKCENCEFATERTSHNFAIQVSVEPSTCEKYGSTVTACMCGETHTEILNSKEHIFSEHLWDDEYHWDKCARCDAVTEQIKHIFCEIVASKQSSCFEHGFVITACECGAKHIESLPLQEHNHAVYCKESEFHWQKCENCDSLTDKSKHEYVNQVLVVPSTCDAHGSRTAYCVCGESHIDMLPLAEHLYTKIAYDSESHWTVCCNCSAKYPGVGTLHDLSSQVVDAVCGEAGKIITTCSGCDYSKTIVLERVEHELNKDEFASTVSDTEHYYTCKRCGELVAEKHRLVNLKCPDGLDVAATCYETGHQDVKCEICGWQNHTVLPKTEEHKFSLEWSYDDFSHWHTCVNGDGKCEVRSNEANHSWKEIITEPSCINDGYGHYECSCGAVKQSGKEYPSKLGHEYVLVKEINAPSCTAEGIELRRCSRCADEQEFITPMSDHEMSQYEQHENGHYALCENCGYKQDILINHVFVKKMEVEPSCTEKGVALYTCELCGYSYRNDVNPLGHNYVTNPNSYRPATCKEYATYSAMCARCKDVQIVKVESELGEHTLNEYPAKDKTDIEPGNIHYWRCSACAKYFADENANLELSENEVFIYPAGFHKVESIAALNEIAGDMPDGESDDYYQISAVVNEITDVGGHKMLINDGQSLSVTFIDRENIRCINIGTSITVKGKIRKVNGVVELTECVVVSLDNNAGGKYSLFITLRGEISDKSFYAESNEVYYFPNTNNYNCFEYGSTLTVAIYTDAGFEINLKINGDERFLTGGETLEIIVTRDTYLEFEVVDVV